ncbi:MAG: tRNA lysidine(34) synthetase TilS, partial [Flavobacteriaceae bacterium]|nr:tRNA lysidine(34) synthetase TilS [Flavobacteriaceae bacterium]
PVFQTSFDTNAYVKAHKVSIQMGARTLRYDWFDQLIKTHEYQFVLTAHHREDALETMFINLSRGTGIDGLLGIPEKRGYIRRPLLSFAKQALLEFANNNQIAWREDSTNASTAYLRNKIRHEVLPLMADLHPTALENMEQTQLHLKETSQLASLYLEQLKKDLWSLEANEIHIPIELLLATPSVLSVIYGLFSPYGFNDANAVLELCQLENGKKLLSVSHLLLKDRSVLILTPIEASQIAEESVLIFPGEYVIEYPIQLSVSKIKEVSPADHHKFIIVDEDTLSYPLQLRHPKEGDVFYPNGMIGKKRVSKFLRDEKINVISKASIWLLTDAKDQIIWVVGYRADRRFVSKLNTDKSLYFNIL